MSKIILKRVVSGFMILLMVVGIFVAVSNFTATSAYATKPTKERGIWLPLISSCCTLVSWNCTVIRNK